MIANGCLSIQVEMYPTTSSEAVSQEGENPQEVLQEVWKENSGRKYTAEASTSQDALQSDSKGSETYLRMQKVQQTTRKLIFPFPLPQTFGMAMQLLSGMESLV